MTASRRLAAILAADIAGYSALMGADEERTVVALKNHQAAVLPMIAEHDGRIIDSAGDGVLAEFASVLNAVRCAIAIQESIEQRNAGVVPAKAMRLRIGINLGDVLFDESRIYGDAINIAARLEAIAEPGGIAISAKVYEEIRGKVEASFHDLGEKNFKNIARPVHAYAVKGVSSRPDQKFTAISLALPDKPSIVVLPFTSMSGDPEREHFADGITEDITTALSRLRWLFVIARNSAFTYKGKAVDVRQVARDLGVRYLLEGSVRASGQRIRVTGQLIDAEAGKHIWAEKYDRGLEDVFSVQDEITEQVVAAIEPHLYAEEGFRARSRPPDSLDSWGLVVRALTLINKVGREPNAEAQNLLRRAIEVEPHYARAHAALGWAQWWSAFANWDQDRQRGLDSALESAERSLVLDPDEPWGRMVSGLVLSTAGSHVRATEELEAAIRLNPSFALAHTVYGLVLLRAGRFDDAIEMTLKARRMSPIDSFAGMYTAYHGLALLGARRFSEALPFMRASLAAFPEFIGHYNTLISCCGHLGLQDDARAFIDHRSKIGPPLTLSSMRKNLGAFAHCAVFVEGLAKAGVPEGVG